MFWGEGEDHRLRLELPRDAADAEGAPRAHAAAQGPARVPHQAWVGGHLGVVGYQAC